MADHHAPTAPGVVEPPHTHGAHDDAAHVQAHVRKYLGIGLILILCTGLTVGLAYVNFGSRHNNFIIAMIVATFKVTLVGAYFMHLKQERITIWRFLIFTTIFVLGLFFLTLLHVADPIGGRIHKPNDVGTLYNEHT
jgi:cytochrome c oxidase subunit 4